MTVYLAGAGLCSSLGATLDASWLAYRAGVSGYQQSSFPTKINQSALLASVPDSLIRATLPGCEAMQDVTTTTDRSAKILNYAFEDLIGQTGLDVELPTYVLQHEPEQDFPNISVDTWKAIGEGLVMPFSLEETIGLPLGRAAFAEAVLQFERSAHTNALVIAAHAPLDYDWLEKLDGEDRLKAAGVSDGFVPGELGLAVILSKDKSRAQAFSPSPISISRVELMKGNGRYPGSASVNVSTLFSCEQRSLADMPDRGIRLISSTHNGESFWNRSMSLSRIRLADKFTKVCPTIYPAEFLGDAGCCAGALSALWAAMHLREIRGSDSSMASHALLQIQSDNGWCASSILSAFPPG